MSLEAIFERGTQSAMDFIMSHKKKDAIIAMYTTGPPEGNGFMWCSSSDFPNNDQQEAYQIMKKWVLDAGFDSSAYGIMHRYIQQAIRKLN